MMKGIPQVDVATLKSSSYDDLVQSLITSLHACTEWIQTVDVTSYKRAFLVEFIRENRKKVAEWTAIIDTHSEGYAGYTSLHLNELDASLDRHLFEYDEACNALQQRLDIEKPIKTKAERVKRLATLIFFCLMSFVISTNTTYAVKTMQNSHLHKKLPVLIALMQSCSVIPNLCIWMGSLLYKRTRNVERSSSRPFCFRLRAYLILGVVDAIHIILQSFSLTELQGSLYTVLKSSGIIFSVVLSKVIVRKVFLLEHWLAVAIMCVSMVGCALFQQAGPDDFSNFMMGMLLTLSSCFFVALLGVLQQKLMVDFKHTDETVDVMAEGNFFQSIVAFPIVIVAALFVNESQEWHPIITGFYNDNNYAFFMLVGTLVVSRSLSVFSAMGVTTYASAMFSRSYGAIRQSLQVIVLSFLLHERFTDSKVFALVMSSISFCIYVYAGHLLQQQKMGKAAGGLRSFASKFFFMIRSCSSEGGSYLPK